MAGAYLFNSFFIDSGMSLSVMLARLSDARFTAGECLSALTLAISVLVVAVPEGLPMMITVVLSSNMNRMIKKNVLVRRMVGIETSGNLGILFCDKTGTLTEGKMSLSRIITPDGEYPSGNAFVRDGEMLGCILSPAPSSGRNQTDHGILRFCRFDDAARNLRKGSVRILAQVQRRRNPHKRRKRHRRARRARDTARSCIPAYAAEQKIGNDSRLTYPAYAISYRPSPPPGV